ncbi:LysM peptidoglycan-binding domain-containing protein, partial [bacterium]|nr:LysM peptidoglycan-binding domain-containing protein [bacterium]
MTIKRAGRITNKNRQFLTIGTVSCYVSILELYRDLPYPSHQKAISCQLGWHRMEFRKLKMQYLYLFFVLTLFVITSCIPKHEGLGPKVVSEAPVISPEAPGTIPKTGKVTREDRTRARQYVRKAIALLQTGEEEEAKKKLSMALYLDPNNKRAKKLLEQINTDPETYLGKEYSHYTVQYSESLSIIAERFLGDSLKFYILARYNAIKNPDLLKSGQIIKIPKKTRVPRVTPQVREEPQKEAPKVSLPVPA